MARRTPCCRANSRTRSSLLMVLQYVEEWRFCSTKCNSRQGRRRRAWGRAARGGWRAPVASDRAKEAARSGCSAFLYHHPNDRGTLSHRGPKLGARSDFRPWPGGLLRQGADTSNAPGQSSSRVCNTVCNALGHSRTLPGTTWHDRAPPMLAHPPTRGADGHILTHDCSPWHDPALRLRVPQGLFFRPPEFCLYSPIRGGWGLGRGRVCNGVCNGRGHNGARGGTAWHDLAPGSPRVEVRACGARVSGWRAW